MTWGFWVVLVPDLFWLFLFFLLVVFLVFNLILLRAHAGYLHLDKALYRWSSSCFNNWGLEQMVLALWSRVPITLYLDGGVWWLSHCRYRSVCVGFLKTVLLRLPSSFGIINTSRNGMDPSSLCSSRVNWICWSIQLMWSREALLCDDSKMVNVSSTNLFQKYGGCGAVLMAFSSKFPYISWQQLDWWENPWQLLLVVQNVALGRWNRYSSGRILASRWCYSLTWLFSAEVCNLLPTASLWW